jgi:hypothetical protein
MRVEEYAASKTAAERAAEAAQIEEGVKMGLGATTPQQWDALVTQAGAEDLVGQFENREAIAQRYMSVAEILKGQQPAAPLEVSPGATLVDPQTRQPIYTAPATGPSTVINNGGAPTNIGTIPQGYAAIPDPSNPAGYRMERIPGGPEDNTAAVALQAEGDARSSQVVLEDIGRLREAIKGAPFYNPATGFGAERLSEVGGTNAADAKAIVDTLSANIGFDRLQQMREASPTGGALGAISDTEMRLLSSVLGSLSQRQSAAQFQENLDRLEVIYSAIATKAAAYPGQGGAANPAPQPGQPVVIDGFTIEAIE